MIRRLLLVVLFAAALAHAASGDEEAQARELQRILASRPVVRRDDPIVVATPAKKPGKPPARFTARPLTPPVEGYFFTEPKNAPPLRHVADLVCLGDAPMRKQWLSALEAAARAGKDAFELGEGYGDWLHECEREEACRFFAASARAAKSAAMREHLWGLTEYGCDRPALADVFLAPATPDAVVVRWLSSFRHGAGFPEWNSRYAEALGRFVRTEKIDPKRIYDPLVVAAETFSSWGDKRAVDALLAAHAGLGDAQRKTLLAIGMSSSRDARAVALFKAACKVPANEEQCRYRGPPDPEKPLTEQVAASDFEPLRWLASNPGREQDLKKALLACYDVREHPVLVCLKHLARIDWAAARKQAVLIAARFRAQDPEQPTPYEPPLLVTLARFESREALLSWAAARKLGGTNAVGNPVLISELLAAAGRSLTLEDPENGLYPDHSHVMRVIASAATDLRGALFEQRKLQRLKSAPWKSYEVIAWMDGVRFSVEAVADEDDDTYDVHVAVAFANALLRQRKSLQRALVFIDSDTHPGPAIAVLPEDTLRELVREKLIEALRDPLQPEPEPEEPEEPEE